jgi:hypothetical protein
LPDEVLDKKLESGVLVISWLLDDLTSMIGLSPIFFLKLLVAEQLYDLIEILDADELCLSSVVDSVDESGRGAIPSPTNRGYDTTTTYFNSAVG